MAQTTQNSRTIKATAETIYDALTNPKAMEEWQVPGKMTGKVHRFDLRQGGGYEMSLFYPESETAMKGKTVEKEDRFTAKFKEIIPNRKITELIRFISSDEAFAGEMIMEIILESTSRRKETKVTFTFKNIPKGIRPADNEAGTESSLEKLAKFVE